MGRNIVQNRTIAAFCKNYAVLGTLRALPGLNKQGIDGMLYIIRGMGFEIAGHRRYSGILHQRPVRLLEIPGSQILQAMDSGRSYSRPIGYRLPPSSGIGLASDLISDSHYCVPCWSANRRETAAIL
jgi:hypothetical protein